MSGQGFGGNQDDVAQGIALNPQADAYIVGYTNSGAFPIVPVRNSDHGSICEAYMASHAGRTWKTIVFSLS